MQLRQLPAKQKKPLQKNNLFGMFFNDLLNEQVIFCFI